MSTMEMIFPRLPVGLRPLFSIISGTTLAATRTTMMTRITIVDRALMVGLILLVILYTTMEMFFVPFPVTK